MAKFTAQSVKRFRRLCEILPQEIKAPVLTATFNEAEGLRREMIFRVPTGATSDLRDSIRVEKARAPMRVLVKAGGDATTRNGYDYANAQEFGTEKMPANPFFWVSYRKRKTSIRRNLKIAARIAIDLNWRERE